jgi:hypothetical protein
MTIAQPVGLGLKAALLAWILAVDQLAAQTPGTAEFAVSDHAQLEGIVTGRNGSPAVGAYVSIRFPGIGGGISSPRAFSDSGGRFTLLIQIYGRGGTIPENLDSLPAHLYASFPISDASEKLVLDSTVTCVRFSPVELTAPVTRVRIRLR